MPREAELSLNERTFALQALQENIRLDERALDACRPLNITFGTDYGTADIQLGKTRYYLPHLQPLQPLLTISAEFLPASPPASLRRFPIENSTAYLPSLQNSHH